MLCSLGYMQGTALGIIAVGLVFTVLFHVGITEPGAPLEQRAQSYTGPWYKWFASPRFYMVSSAAQAGFSYFMEVT